MGSTFAGLSLFDSGPHRFAPRTMGRLWLPPLAVDALQETTLVLDVPRELMIAQTGRLIADDDAGLWGQVDVIRGHAEAALTGTLVEASGRAWAGVTLLGFSPAEQVDRGRRVSLSYSAVYIDLA